MTRHPDDGTQLNAPTSAQALTPTVLGLVASTSRRTGKLLLGILLGAKTSLMGLAFLLVAATILLASRVHAVPPDWTPAMARRLVGIEQRRLRHFFDIAPAERDADERLVRYLAARIPIGLLGGAVLFLLFWGLVSAAVWAQELLLGHSTTARVLSQVLAGVVLLFLAVQGMLGIVAGEERIVRRFLHPSERELLHRRITELADSRAGIVAAVDAERRRIERDLHDGVQQRVVALAMLLGRAGRGKDPARRDDLLHQAHAESQRLLVELREVSWQVYPTALDELGLAEALQEVAARSAVPVRLRLADTEGLPPTVQTAAYFVVREAVTNAAKHSGARSIDVSVHRQETMLVVRIDDDGRGGADADGGGLAGLARRVAAVDGDFTVHSPMGGPTTIGADLPCA
ncbi:sensor histidine kinase [Actinoalloteichus hymeniacidonis]|uniref:histidine kinase n=1 Tax=Actinoalloteichus hymeniacidonis TaxID=340345 RepID=A0AAC9HMA9_9PSEU|nr:histidine kinase [Actinoalloteichus hymeniacidonis]AOS61855.1 signal transduction histidine kinase [Actinoalloteichus hymeniacidonis]MBB5910125.1 signal transduction histidine kinase [Actinoalloteichus hymeniacidonis]